MSGIVTQNVDGLHRRAGSRHVVELHGGMDRVLCLTCGQHYARQAIADRLAELNPDDRPRDRHPRRDPTATSTSTTSRRW